MKNPPGWNFPKTIHAKNTSSFMKNNIHKEETKMKKQNPVVEVVKIIGKPIGCIFMMGIGVLTAVQWTKEYFNWLNE